MVLPHGSGLYVMDNLKSLASPMVEPGRQQNWLDLMSNYWVKFLPKNGQL